MGLHETTFSEIIYDYFGFFLAPRGTNIYLFDKNNLFDSKYSDSKIYSCIQLPHDIRDSLHMSSQGI